MAVYHRSFTEWSVKMSLIGQQSTTRPMSELVTIMNSSARVWEMIVRRDRLSLSAAIVLMAFAAWFNARIPVALGDLGTTMERDRSDGKPWGLSEAIPVLVALAVAFLLREALHVARKYLI